MASGIHDYRWPTQIHTMVTAYALNDTIEAEVKIHFNLERLPKRTATMIMNNFKRGYKLAEGYGKVNSMTNILCEKFNIDRLPCINKHSANFYQKNRDFEKWLIGMGVVFDIPINESQDSTPIVSYWANDDKYDPASVRLLHQAVKKKYKKMINQEQRDLYAEAIDALESGATITRYNEYFLEDE